MKKLIKRIFPYTVVPIIVSTAITIGRVFGFEMLMKVVGVASVMFLLTAITMAVGDTITGKGHDWSD